VSQSGGVAGIARVTERRVEPGTAGHDAAIRVIDAERPAASPTRRPDTFRYDVSIGGPDGELWRATVSDPLPDTVAELLDAIR
jgi:hypothetical protein